MTRGDNLIRRDGAQCMAISDTTYRTFGLPNDHLIHEVKEGDFAPSEWKLGIPPLDAGWVLVRLTDGSVRTAAWDPAHEMWWEQGSSKGFQFSRVFGWTEIP